MANATSRLQILIDAKNNASPALKQVADSAKSASGSGLDLGDAFGLAFSAAGAMQIAKSTMELAEIGAQADQLSVSFGHLAASSGQSSDAMLAAMQQAAQGTISAPQLMPSANTALMLGVADSASEMAQLLEVAAARGKAFGVSTA